MVTCESMTMASGSQGPSVTAWKIPITYSDKNDKLEAISEESVAQLMMNRVGNAATRMMVIDRMKAGAERITSKIRASLQLNDRVKRKSGSGKVEAGAQCPARICREGGSFEGTKARGTAGGAGTGILQPGTGGAEGAVKKVDKCDGVEQSKKVPTFKETIFTRIAKERYKVRRIRRKKAKPGPVKKKSKDTKTTQLRLKFSRNEKIVPADSQAHIKKYRRPPFKNIAVVRLCFEKLGATLEKLKVAKKSPTKKKPKKK